MLTIQNNWETGNKGSLETFCSPPRVNGTFSYFSYQVIAIQCQWFSHKQTVKYHCCGDILQDSVWFIFWVGVAQGRGFPAFSPGSKMVQVILSEQHLYFCMSTCISIRCTVTSFFFLFFDDDSHTRSQCLVNATLELQGLDFQKHVSSEKVKASHGKSS